jgi:hypothetical protein
LQNKEPGSRVYYDLENNLKLDSLTRDAVSSTDDEPKFVYTHLMMPHLPYYFDSSGKPQPVAKLTDAEFHTNKNAYISYLKYSNKKLLELIDFIKTTTKKPSVIILCGDHACRECLGTDREIKYQTMNLSAIYLSSGKYENFYRGMSNVNVFRSLLNSEFNQEIPILVDSTIIIHAKKGDLW